MDRPPPERIDSYPYRYRVAEVMSRPPITAAPTLALRDAALRMREAEISALVTIDGEGRPQGILTERDLLVAVADRGSAALTSPISEFAHRPVHGVTTDDYLFTAIARMARLHFRHLAVVDPSTGALVGILSARILLQQRAQKALVLGDEIAVVERAEDMAALYRRLPDLAAGLLRDGMAARQIAAVLSAVLRDINARAAALAEAAMTRPAPAAWCFLVLGSGGRGESLLVPDQDNAIVHAGAAADDAWFAEVGKRAADFLDQVGIPYCRGGVMAMNKECRHSLEGWRQRIAGWVERPEPVNLLNADIFYDFRPVHGDFALAGQLREVALEAAKSRQFLAMLGAELSDMGTPLGMFGFKTEQGRVDLKKGGLLPLVSAARVMALRDGSAALDTYGRLEAAVAAGRLGRDDEVQLKDAHELLLRVVLEQQIADIRAGVAPSTRVLVARLDGLTRRRLKEALRRIADVDWTVRDSLTGT